MSNKGIRKDILDNGLYDVFSKEELIEYKKEATRKRKIERQKQYRKEKIRIETYVDIKTYSIFKKAAQKHGKKRIPLFVIECALAYLNQCFLLPEDSKTNDLELALLRWGNNLNQIAKQVNTFGAKYDEVKASIDLVNSLERFVSDTYRNPKSLRIAIQEELENNSEFLEHLKRIIHQLES